MKTEKNQKPKKCWYCAHIAECDKLEPCERFKKWINPNSVYKFAERHNVQPKTLYRWINKGKAYAQHRIHKDIGLIVRVGLDDDGKYEIEEIEE